MLPEENSFYTIGSCINSASHSMIDEIYIPYDDNNNHDIDDFDNDDDDHHHHHNGIDDNLSRISISKDKSISLSSLLSTSNINYHQYINNHDNNINNILIRNNLSNNNDNCIGDDDDDDDDARNYVSDTSVKATIEDIIHNNISDELFFGDLDDDNK